MHDKTIIYYYTTTSGDNPVKEFLDGLSFKQQTKILRIFQIIQEYGLISALPHIKKLTGTPFWEIRILGKDNIRVIYIVPEQNHILVLSGFIKKTDKTPQREINIAQARWKDWKKRVIDK